MPPPTKIAFACLVKALSKSILVETFAPPTIANIGCFGFCNKLFRFSNSYCINKPAKEGKN